jgi:ribosomal protein L40E
MHVALGAMLFVLVMIVTAVLFTGWVVVMLVRWLWAALTMSSAPVAASRGAMDSRMCIRDHCRAINPMQAKFCRRCGSAMSDVAAGPRRVAS